MAVLVFAKSSIALLTFVYGGHQGLAQAWNGQRTCEALYAAARENAQMLRPQPCDKLLMLGNHWHSFTGTLVIKVRFVLGS